MESRRTSEDGLDATEESEAQGSKQDMMRRPTDKRRWVLFMQFCVPG